VAQLWEQIGPPLRPSEEDLGFVKLAIREWCEENHGNLPRALILGVTPELYRLPWPTGSHVKAADRTPEMVLHVWPGDASDVLLADWRQMDLPDQSLDIVLCDGGFHLMDYPVGQATFCKTLARLMAPAGLFVIRLFVPPIDRECPQDVLDDLMAGEIPNLNCLKLRLGMSLQESPSVGVALNAVWQTLSSTGYNWSELAIRLGWSTEHLGAIDAYRDSQARYHFVTANQVCTMMSEQTQGAFKLERFDEPSYRLGDRCPTLVFKRHLVRNES
jgi:hypothetical protein